MKKHSLLLSCAALTLVGVAFGQEQAPDPETTEKVALRGRLPVVEVIGFRPVSEEDITTSVSVLSASDLAVRDNPFLADQLRAVPGLGVSRTGASGGLTQVRIRGAEANHTLVLIDGIEVSDPTTGETDFGLFAGLYPSRVEVARGEQSALYGSDAIGGVINVVTGDLKGARGLLEAGSFGTVRLDGAYGFDLESGDLQVAFANVISEGVDTSGTGGEKDGYRNTSFLLAGGRELGGDWSARGLLRYGDSEVDTDADIDFSGRPDNADRVTESAQWTLGGTLRGTAIGADHLFRASYNSVARDNFGDGFFLNGADSDRTKLAYSPSVDFGLRGADLTVSGLVDWEQENYTARDEQFTGLTNQDETFQTVGLAGEVRAGLGNLALNASVRHNNNDGAFEDVTTWRVGGAYALDGAGKLRASVGTGVKNPTFTELFGFFPGSFIGNADLKPEQSASWEIGWDRDFGRIQTSLSYFDAKLEDEIFTAFTASTFATPQNRTGNSDRSGFEAALNWQISNSLSLNSALSRIDSSNDDGDTEIRVPKWTSSAAVNWRSLRKDGLRAGLAVDYVGKQLDRDFGLSPPANVTLDPYWLVTATAEYPLTDRLSLTLRGDNLADETVTDVIGYNGPGTGVLVGLRVR